MLRSNAWLSCAALALSMLHGSDVFAQGSATQEIPPLERPRILVRYDMEGMSGQSDWRTAAAWWPEQYLFGQKLLAADVNAVVAGLFDAGASIVDVVDQHGSGNPGFNLPPELLDQRVRQLLHRHDAPPVGAGTYDAVVMVAMHGATGSGGFMAHSGTFGIDWIINGRSISEAERAAYAWGEAGIPVIFVSGDDRLRDDLLPVMPWLEYVVTKRSLSPQEVELRPVDVVRDELRTSAARAVQGLANVKPLRVTTPIRGAVRAVPPADLSILRHVPAIDHSNEQVSFVAATWAEAARALDALSRIAVAMGGQQVVDEILHRSPLWPEIERLREAGFWEYWIEMETQRAQELGTGARNNH